MRPVYILSTPLRVGGFLAILLSLMLVTTQCRDSLSGMSEVTSATPEFSESSITTNNNNSSTLPSGALYEISLPAFGWKDLVIYAHGYENPGNPLKIPDDDIQGIPISTIINNLGFAYATTSYRDNGLVIPEAVEDLKMLLERFIMEYGEPGLVYVVGPSEGAAVTTLAVENHPQLFDAGFATCGPIGDFRKQLNYLGDFHVLFNYFFPDFNIGNPEGVPSDVIDDWNNGTLKDDVTQAILSQPQATKDLLKVAKVPANLDNIDDVVQAVLDLLRYNILATNDAINKLDGHPYGNKGKLYFGTGSLSEDLKLNRDVERFKADITALRAIENEYQTSGSLENPLVTMHTIFDHEVPYWHEPLYQKKVFTRQSSFFHVNLPILGRFGHCNFTINEVLAGFSIMVFKATTQNLQVPSSLVQESKKQQLFDLAKEHGASPVVVPGIGVIQ